MYCYKCGQKNEEDTIFCKACGVKIREPANENESTFEKIREPAKENKSTFGRFFRSDDSNEFSPFVMLLCFLGLGIFLGIFGIGVGVGSEVPSIFKIAGPVVCSDEQLVTGIETYSWRPGEYVDNINAACMNGVTGELRDVTTQMMLVAGSMYGLIIFILLYGSWVLCAPLRRRRFPSGPQKGAAT